MIGVFVQAGDTSFRQSVLTKFDTGPEAPKDPCEP